MNDKELLEGLRSIKLNEREQCLRYLYKHNYEIIEKHILSNNGSYEEAKDLFQDVIIAFFNKVRNKEFELTCKISTFLFAMSKNQWLKKLRRKKNLQKAIHAKEIEVVEDRNMEFEMIYSEQQVELAKLLKQSGQKCLELLKAFYFEKLSMNELADQLGYSSSQVARNQKVRCIKKIKALILNNNSLNTYWNEQ